MRSKLIYIVLAGLLLVFGVGISKHLPSDTLYPDVGTYHLINKATLKHTGPIDEAMLDCALSWLTPDVKTVYVTTPGREVYAGRAIGYKVSEHPRHLIVNKFCLSSCGNYFVPAASRLTLLPKSIIGLHGTPDPYTFAITDVDKHMAGLIEEGHETSESLKRIVERKSERREKQLLKETKLSSHLNVP